MNILIDKDILYAKKIFEKLGKIKLISYNMFNKSLLKNSDAVIIRSNTPIKNNILKNSKIKFLGTVTSGIDHIDQEYIKKSNICFSHASGCNSTSVVEYIFSVLFFLSEHYNFDLKEKIVGIIGVGNIGSLLNKYLNVLGIKTLLYDPPLSKKIKNKEFVSLEKIINHSHIISLHVPLKKYGKNPTYHLFNEEIFDNLSSETIVINTSRGLVIDENALLKVLKKGKKIRIVLDVWSTEPYLSELLCQTIITTPHIAGYSLEGRIKSVLKIHKDYCKYFNKKNTEIGIKHFLPQSDFKKIFIQGKLTQKKLKKLIHLIYDVRDDDINLKKKLGIISKDIYILRKKYSIRREWSSIKVQTNNFETKKILKKIGFYVK
ncbi:MAG: 4-phosphoerythronate dehydrogenase [Arsenophonus sp.]|nr:MAG: 4-phosphoerythronate dehydrogenase [Arsenophonus sp.]